MATFKILVQKKRKDGFYIVYIRLTHNRQVCYIKTDKVVNETGLVHGTKEVKDTFVLTSLLAKINDWVTRLNHVDTAKWTLEEVRKYIEIGEDDVCFSKFAREYIDSLYDTLESKTVDSYINALNSLENFAVSDKVMFTQLTVNFVEKWIKSLLGFRSAKFTYPTLIKRIFNEGVKKYNDYDNNVIRIKNNPWIKITIPKIDKAEKKAITMEECRRFFAVMPRNDGMRMSMDICKMILCLAGINVADLYSMQKSNYYDNILHYERRKTRGRRDDNAYMEIRVPDMLLPTIERNLADKDDPFLFKFHKFRTLSSINNILHWYLKDICHHSLEMEEGKQYTPYTFRHTWATVAQNDVGAMYEEIAFAMNHTSAHKVTMGYVKTDFSPAWNLNEKVVEKIFFTNEKSRSKAESKRKVFAEINETFELSAEAYYMGNVVGRCGGSGYRNIDEIVTQLMASLDESLPRGSAIQIKITNITNQQTKFLERSI